MDNLLTGKMLKRNVIKIMWAPRPRISEREATTHHQYVRHENAICKYSARVRQAILVDPCKQVLHNGIHFEMAGLPTILNILFFVRTDGMNTSPRNKSLHTPVRQQKS